MAVRGEVQKSHHDHRQVDPQVVAEEGDEDTSGAFLLLYLERAPSRPTMSCVAQPACRRGKGGRGGGRRGGEGEGKEGREGRGRGGRGDGIERPA